jgi:hypothetical protein
MTKKQIEEIIIKVKDGIMTINEAKIKLSFLSEKKKLNPADTKLTK